jgi:cysteine desulfurase
VSGDGRVEAGEVLSSIRPDTTLVSVMHANNETGVLQPVGEIGRGARSRGVVFHTDAAQSVGKIAVTVDDLEADLVTIAAHKLYGPKGVGALYIRRGTPFAPLLHGAGHERGLRSGTENVPQIVGLGAACELARSEIGRRANHLRGLRDRLEQRLRATIPDLVVHGSGVERLPNTLSAAIPAVDANLLLGRLDNVATAAGAACHSGTSEPSRVLRAMGVPDDLAVCTLRLTVGRPTTVDEIDAAAAEIGRRAVSLR